MMMMTAKVDIKKVIAALAAVAGVVIALILLLGGRNTSTTTAAPSVAGNDGRMQFLAALGWEVSASPTESGQVRIPQEQNDVFSRYNELQKSAGYDLSQYAGKTVMRYVYQVNNFPDASKPVYATLLIYKNQVIGGDITNTAVGGTMQALTKNDTPPAATQEPTAPAVE